jgi:hypothetical protein
MDPMTAMSVAGGGANAIGGVVKGLTGIASGIIGSKKRKREEAAAQQEYDMFKNQYAELDTSNLYANLENTMEDLTVDQRAAEFQLQAQQQGQANIMDQMAGAAGGAGIAALAQAMANQQTQGAAQAAASIGQQERANQMAAASQAAQLQQLEASGAETARSLEYQKTSTQLGMAQQRLGAAKAARAAATQSIIGGIGDFAMAGVGAAQSGGGEEGMFGGDGFGANMLKGFGLG